MDISALMGTSLDSVVQTPTMSSKLTTDFDSLLIRDNDGQSVFGTVLDSAVNLINETNAYSNAAEEEEIKYALGETDNIHDLQIAQLRVEYKKAAVLGDMIYPKLSKEADRFVVELCDEQAKPNAVLEFKEEI